MLTRDVSKIIEEYAPIASGIAGDELGLWLGDADAEVTGVVTCWSATLDVLHKAVAARANMVISHEVPTFGMRGVSIEGKSWFKERMLNAKLPNQKRLLYALSNDLTIYRYHSNWDFAPRIGIHAALAKDLGLTDCVYESRVAPVYKVKPATVAEMASRARKALNLGPVRLIGDPERKVSRIALCYGGFGQMSTFPETAQEGKADMAFFGEMIDYCIRYCVEIDLPVVELGHYKTEQCGMAAMAGYLRTKLPKSIPVMTIEAGEPWTVFEG